MYEVVTCPQCQRRLRLPAEHLGREVQCANCGVSFTAGIAYLVRSLVRLKRNKDALKEAETFNKIKHGPRILLALALAASGDTTKTVAFLEKSPGRRYFLESCYYDDDLGPILRGKEYTAFRKRFPEPPSRDP